MTDGGGTQFSSGFLMGSQVSTVLFLRVRSGAIWRAPEEQSLSFVRASVTVRPNCPIASVVRIDLALPSRSTLTFRTVRASLSCANSG